MRKNQQYFIEKRQFIMFYHPFIPSVEQDGCKPVVHNLGIIYWLHLQIFDIPWKSGADR